MKIEMNANFPASRREQVANIIRDAIITGELKPGDKIREKEISEKLAISRGPIREAMRQLVEEGLLISYPYKETVVAELSDDEIINVFIPIRVIVEKQSILKACENLQDEQINTLQDYADKMIDFYHKRDFPNLAECNILFHKYIVSLSGSKSLEHVWNSITNRIRIHFHNLGLKLDIATLEKDAMEHQEIIDALKERNVEKACRLIEKNIK